MQTQVVFIVLAQAHDKQIRCSAFFLLKPNSCGINISGGDYILDPKMYRDLIRDSLIIITERSGMTQR